jgi:hypothetical protein
MLPALGAALLLTACQVTPVTNETTPPTVTVTLIDKLANQGWAGNQYVIQAGGLVTVNPNLDILIEVSAHDPGGMKELSGAVGFYVNACGSESGGGYMNSLDSFDATATHNPPNTVTDTLPYAYEVTTAQLKALPCDYGKNGSSGLGTVRLLATAVNQSNQMATGIYMIHTQGGVIPQ